MVDDNGTTASFGVKTITLFAVAAGLMAITAGVFAAEGVLDSDMDLLLGLFAPGGFGIAFLGVLGLYPALADRARTLARAGALFLVIGVIGAIVLVVSHLAQLAGVLADQPTVVTAANLPLLLGVVLGFGAFAIGGIRTAAYSGTVGLLLAWPAVVFGGLILGSVSGITYRHWVHIAHSGSEAIVYLSVAYVIRTSRAPADRTAHDVSEAPARE